MFKPGAYLLPLSGIVTMNIKVYICSLFHGFIYGMISISGVYVQKKKSKVNLRYNCAENVSLIKRFNGECAVWVWGEYSV